MNKEAVYNLKLSELNELNKKLNNCLHLFEKEALEEIELLKANMSYITRQLKKANSVLEREVKSVVTELLKETKCLKD